MVDHRAYSILDVREVSDTEDAFVIKGIASTPSTDRMGDIVEPLGAKFKIPMPLLWQHRHDAPVGNVIFAKATRNGIPFEAQLPNVREEGNLKARVDEARQSIQYGLVTAVSIGFKADYDQMELLDSGGIRFKEWEWLELSLVTIPANSEALLAGVKSFDSQLRRAALGREASTVFKNRPGDSGKRGFFYLRPPNQGSKK